MSIMKYYPWQDDEWSELEKTFSGAPSVLRQSKSFIPVIDVYQDENNLIVETPLPGVDPEKVEIFVEDDKLIIRGKSEHKKEIEEKNYYRKEVREGHFYRSVVLPMHVLGDKAKASYKNGFLEIKIPKAIKKKQKVIKIKVNKK